MLRSKFVLDSPEEQVIKDIKSVISEIKAKWMPESISVKVSRAYLYIYVVLPHTIMLFFFKQK